MCAVSMLVGAPWNCSRFVCRNGFHEDVLDSVYVPILLYCCTRMQYFALAIILSDSGERMHRDKIPPQRMHAACHIVTRGSCCAKRFAEFNGNCESCCSLEQLVASLSAADWTRISRHPIIAIAWHFSQQTLLEPLAVSGARASCSVNDIGMYCTRI